jgi:NAD(P)-dependent dehydrogenase (short-subunit alcohol dehydrogenase family)
MNEISAQLAGDGLDYLVNNAGIATTAPLELIPMDDFRQQMAVNVEGVLLVTQAALPFMRKNTDARQARIVNIGSVSGIVAFPAMGAYCASKFALEAITDSLRMELMAHDIDVCLVQPGPVKTPIWKKSQSAGRARLEQMGQLVNEHYGELMQAMKKSAEDAEKKGVRVERVVEAVEHALTARRPRTRYLVGKGIRQVLWLARLLGDRRRDRIVMKKLGAD